MIFKLVTRSPYLKPFAIALPILGLLLILWNQAGNWYNRRLILDARTSVNKALLPRGNALTTTISRDFSLIQGLVAFVEAHPDFNKLREHFELYATGLLAGNHGIRVVQVFPKGAPVLVHPVAGNEAAIGRELEDLINDERQHVRTDVRRALQTRRVTLSGPYKLRQHGLGIVARQAIFHNNELWGIVAVVLDIPKILNNSGLKDPGPGLRLALEDVSGNVFWGDRRIFQEEPVVYTVALPEGEWTLGAVPDGGWTAFVSRPRNIFKTIGLIVVVLLAVLAFVVAKRQTRLQSEVLRQSSDLLNEQSKRERAEEWRHLAVRAANIGLWDWDLRTNRVYYSSEWKSQIGYEDHEIADDFSEWESRVHPDDLDRTLRTIRRYISNPWPNYRLEFRFRHKDGSYRWILTGASLLYDEHGQPLRMHGSHLDITERKKMEETLKHREALLSETGKLAKIGGWEFDPLTREGTWTDEVARIHDMAPQEETDVEIGLGFYHGEHRITIERAVKEAVELGRPYDLELEMVTAKGVHKWVKTIGQPVKEGDRVVKVRGSIQDISEKKRAEQALRDSEERFRTAFEYSASGMCLTNPDSTLLRVNTALCNMLGFTKEELEGKHFNSITHPEDTEIGNEVVRDLLDGQAPYATFEKRYLRKTGEAVWARINAALLTYASGEPQHFIIQIEDITERVQMEASLQERRHFLQHILDTEPGTVYIYDLTEHRNVYTNRNWMTAFGYTPEEILAMGSDLPGRIFHPDDLSRIRAHHESWRQSGEGDIREIEYRIRDKTGRWHWIHSRETVFTRDNTSQAKQILGIAHDVTEQKRAEEKIKRYTERLSILRDVDQDIILPRPEKEMVDSILKRLRKFIRCRRAGLALISENRMEFQIFSADFDFESAFGPMAQAAVTPKIIKDLSAGRAFIIADHHLVPQKDYPDSPKLVEEGILTSIIAPLIFSGQLMGVLDLGADKEGFFTEEHLEIAGEIANQLALALHQARLKKQIEDQNVELEQRVQERTAELEAKNQELETFAYTVSHDLKSPLRGIDGYSRLLEEDYSGKLDEEGLEFLANVRQAASRMNQLVDDLLAYSRVERRTWQMEDVNPGELLELLLAERAVEIEDRGITVRINALGPIISADPDGLTMALRNLLDNALKFTRDVSGPIIEVGGRLTDGASILWVRDNGLGFEMRFHNRIFEIFQRLHRYEDFPGTGVGLAIARKALERMGGRIWAESESGQGATFYLEIPRRS